MSDYTFPLDWDQWRRDWAKWETASGLRKAPRNPWARKGKNFLADSVLGVYRTRSGRTVELSEVTFPNLSERDAATGRLLSFETRYIGLTFEDGETGLVRSFTELVDALA